MLSLWMSRTVVKQFAVRQRLDCGSISRLVGRVIQLLLLPVADVSIRGAMPHCDITGNNDSLS